MHINTLIHARWVIPVEPHELVLEHHSIALHAGRIQAILPSNAACTQYSADHTIELPQHALLPGLINAHTHSPMTLFRGLADDLPLMTWLQEHIWPAEAHWVNADFVADGSRLAIAEMLRSGTTCFSDMYFFPDITAQVATEMGMRSVIGLILLDAPTRWAKDATTYLQQAQRVHAAVQDEPLITTMLAPHAPYTVSDHLLQRAVAEYQLPQRWHMHVHETAAEIQQSLEQHGMRPLQRLQHQGLLNAQLTAVHMTQLTRSEIEQLATCGVHIVHCPESNLKLAAGACPVQHLVNAGVNVALGTDGAASNNDLDMLGEMRTAALFAKQVAQDASAISAAQVIRMATLNGAKALGLETEIGTLAPGKAADIIAIDLNDPACQPIYNPLSQIVYSATRAQVSDVWVAGKQRVAHGQLVGQDIAAYITQAQTWQQHIAARQAIPTT